MHVATNQVAMVLVERSFTPEQLIRQGDTAGFAKLFMERIGNSSPLNYTDEYKLFPELVKAHADEIALATTQIKTRYSQLIRSKLQDIIDGQAILDNAPIPLDI